MINVRMLNQLSQRERECVNYMAKGYTAKKIAKELNISNRTVEAYLDNVKRKLRCQNRAELIYKIFQTTDEVAE